MSIDGGLGTNSFIETDGTNVWHITDTNKGYINATSFAFDEIQNLTGGTGDDTFIFTNAKGLTGSINGGTIGITTNKLDYSLYTTKVDVVLTSAHGGVATGISGFSNINNIIGNTNVTTNTLTGPNIDNTWNITDNDAGNIGGASNFAFSKLQNLIGGTGNDDFVFTRGCGISGAIDGGTIAESITKRLDYSDYQTTVEVTLIGTNAGHGPGMSAIDGFRNINVIVAGTVATDNKLTGPDLPMNWIIDTVAGSSAGTMSFANFQKLYGGSDTDVFTVSTGAVPSNLAIDGGGGSNTLRETDGANTWYVTAENAGRINDTDFTFTKIQHLVAGNYNDIFNINAGSVETISGGGGNDTYHINGGNVATSITGGTGNDYFVFTDGCSIDGTINGGTLAEGKIKQLNYASYLTAIEITLTDANAGHGPGMSVVAGFSNINKITGATNKNNQLTGYNSGLTWTITAVNSGTVGSLAFEIFPKLFGGTGNDTFIVNNDVSPVMDIDGGDGTNSLTKNNGTNTWYINSDNQGYVGDVNFTHIQHLTGGTGNDTFHIDNGSVTTISAIGGTNVYYINGGDVLTGITGGNGNDQFILSNNKGITGSVNGGTVGTKWLDYSDYTALSVQVNLATLTATNISGGISNINKLTGGSYSTTLVGKNQSNIWHLTASDSGNINDSEFVFLVVKNLTGGTANDKFVFDNGVTISGNIDGKAGTTNWIDYSNYTTPITVNLYTSKATGVGNKIININTLTGGQATTNTLIGKNQTNVWNIIDSNSGTINSTEFTFYAIQNLTGGNTHDQFVIRDGGSVAGTISGGGSSGTNWLDYEYYTSDMTVNLQDLTATATGHITSSINKLTGSLANSQLVGKNQSNTWNITSNNGGNVGGAGVFDFYNIKNITGGNSTDTFIFAGAYQLTGTTGISGGAGTLMDKTIQGAANISNTFTLSGSNSGTAQPNGAAGATNFTGIGRLTGGSNATNTLITSSIGENTCNITSNNGGNVGGAAVLVFTDMQNLTGNTATDIFYFNGAYVITGVITGGADGTRATVKGAAGISNDFILSSNNAGTIQPGNSIETHFANIGNLMGGIGGTNILTKESDTNIWTINLENGGNINSALNFSVIPTIIGGADNDTFNINANGSITTIYGSSGNNVYNINGGNVISSIIGGDQNDSFVFVAANGITGTVNGGTTGTKLLDYSSATVDASVNLATLSATNTGGISNINKVIGNSIKDNTLIAKNVVNTWQINNSDSTITASGSVYFTFDNMQNVVGGTGDDAFFLNTGGSVKTIHGGTGDNVYYLDGGNVTIGIIGSGSSDRFRFSSGKSISGYINGGFGGTKWLDYSNDAVDVTVDLGNGTATGTGGVSNITKITCKSSQNNIVCGENVTNEWSVSGDYAGNVTGAEVVTFTGVHNLVGGVQQDDFDLQTGGSIKTIQGGNGNNTYSIDGGNVTIGITGGTGNDDFVFGNGAAIDGSIDGGTISSNTKCLDYFSDEVVVTINLSTGKTTGVGGTFSNINKVVGNDINSTIVGANANNTWNITDNDAGNIDGAGVFDFSRVKNLTGGAQSDRFVFSMAKIISGNIDGASGGTKWLDYSSDAVDATVNLVTNTATGIGGTFDNINKVTAKSSQNNSLIGPTAENTWHITANNSGNIGGVGVFDFYNIQNLIGGSIADLFIFDADYHISGSITGGSGVERIQGPNVYTRWNITGNTGGYMNTASSSTDYSNITNLIGGNERNLFVISANINPDMTITGGSGFNTLQHTNGNHTWYITGQDSGYVNDVVFSHIKQLIGGTDNDLFLIQNGILTGSINGGRGSNKLQIISILPADGNGTIQWVITGKNKGTVAGMSWSNIQSITGSDLDDYFVINNGARLSQTLDGGGGYNTLDYSLWTTPVVVDLGNHKATNIGYVVNIQGLVLPPPPPFGSQSVFYDLTWLSYPHSVYHIDKMLQRKEEIKAVFLGPYAVGNEIKIIDNMVRTINKRRMVKEKEIQASLQMKEEIKAAAYCYTISRLYHYELKWLCELRAYQNQITPCSCRLVRHIEPVIIQYDKDVRVADIITAWKQNDSKIDYLLFLITFILLSTGVIIIFTRKLYL
jgi:hypothetical protein